MLRHGRTALRSLARDWHKVAVGVAVGMLAGGALVYGDGGDASLVHACIEDAVATRANTLIVGPGDACPSGFTPKHWSVQGPQGAQGPAGPVTAGAVSDVLTIPGAKPPPSPTRNQLSKLGVKASKTKKITVSKGPNNLPAKDVLAVCPASHKQAGFGAASISPQNGYFQWVINTKWGPSAWRTSVWRPGPAGAPWKLTVTLTCIRP